MQIEEQQDGEVTTLKPRGTLALSEADQLKKRVEAILHPDRPEVLLIMDVSGVSAVDSRGLEVLVEITQILARTGRFLRLVGARNTLREVLALTDLDGLFEHFADMPSAIGGRT